MRRPVFRTNRVMEPVRAKFHAETLESREVPAVGGTVFQDFSANGALDNGTAIANLGGSNAGASQAQIGTVTTQIDTGVGGVTVTIFDTAGAKVDQVLSSATGTWASSKTVSGQQYRVEFTGLPLNNFQVGPHGANSGTTTQFVADGANTVNLGLVRASDYYRQNPLLVTSEYSFGPITGNTSTAILSFPYNSGASAQAIPPVFGDLQAPADHAINIPTSQVGTTWGLGYNRAQKEAYAAAFTKRHSGMGPAGTGAIYNFDLPSADTPGAVTTANLWVNLRGLTTVRDALTNAVQPAVNTDGAFGAFFTGRAAANYNWEDDGGNTGWNAVGKSSLGGLDVSDDGSTVYVMNLADNRLYIIPVLASGAADTANIRSIAVPVPSGVAAGDVRPWAVEFQNGQVYIGLVDSAESDQDRATLRGYVFAFNPTTNAFGPSLVNDAGGDGFDLSYARGSSFAGSDDFRAWSPTYNRVLDQDAGGLKSSQYPQPMLTGLAFDRQGNLTLSIRDRNGDQTGRGTLSNGPEAGPPLLAGSMVGRVEGVASGELLKAFTNPASAGTFLLESAGANPSNASQVGTAPASGKGPGGGEFFGEDDFAETGHGGTSLGGVVQVPGFESVVNTHFDPFRESGAAGVRSGGTRWFNGPTGVLEKSYEIYARDAGAATTLDPNGTFGKANGLGDLIAIEPEDPPIEIGNRLFQDSDRDGVQDPGEPVLQGVTVQLQDSAGGLLATAKTAADGTYYFNSGQGTNSVSEIYGIAALKAGAQYKLVIPNTSGTQQAPLVGLVLTTANATHTGDKTTNDGNGDLRNSDFTQSGTGAVSLVNLTTSPIGRSAPTFDAGFVTGVNLGNFVWEDTNNDGLFNGSEAGINGVTVNLYQASAPSVIVSTQQTSGGGAYLFSGLLPGDYIVEIVSPAGFRSSTGSGADLVNGKYESSLAAGNSTVNNEDHGKAISGNNLTGYTIRANTVTLATADNLNQDFGLVRTYSLGNRVWLDKDNSGKIDAADGLTPGIDGASVKLYAPSSFDASGNLLTGQTALRTVTTAGGGFYRFDDLGAGSYIVVVDGATVGGGKSSTGKANAFEPAAGAIPLPGTTDSDDNGTTITGNLVRSGTFVLGPGAISPTGETDLVTGANPQGTVDGEADMTADFGFFRPLFLGNFVWEDANNNGKFETGENKLSGVTVVLLDSAGAQVGAAQTTDANGNYRFDNLAAGTYTVRVTTPTGFTTSTGKNGGLTGPFEPAAQTTNNEEDHGTLNATITIAKFVESTVNLGDIGSAGNPDTVLTPNDANLRQDFGFFRPLALGDLVFEDKANNGLFDGADTPVTGVLVELLDSTNAVLTSATTGADGKYRFDNLSAGAYTVRITPPAGQNFVSSTGANGKTTGPNEPATGITANNADHGTTQANGTITTTVQLLATGNPDEGGSANLAQDFGLYRPVLLGTLVWGDTNNNGLFDPSSGEAGIGGVTVDLLDSTGTVVASTTTAADGTYQFPVAPGQYRVRITPPTGRVSSTGTGPGNSNSGPYEPSTGKTADNEDHGTTAGTFVQTELITIADPGAAGNPDSAGFANLRQDFGLFTPVALSLGNLVFEDANNNGVRDTGEPAISGANVTLLDSTGKSIGTATTGTDGAYRFDNLPPGSYTVQVVAPTGFRNSDGTQTADNADHGVIDPTTPNKATTTVVLTDPATTPNPDESGKANLRQDFGFFRPQAIGNLVFVDTNNNGKVDAGEAGKSGVTVTLLQGTTVVGTQTTDTNGNYLFQNLLPGTYIVRIAPQTGFVTSTGKNGSTTGPNEPGLTDGTNDADHGTTVGTNIEATVTLSAGATNPDGVDNLRQDFGIFQPLRLGDTVFTDTNKNGKFDATESTLAGVTVVLLDAAGSTVATTTTGTNGKYQFGSLVPGQYTLRVTPPTNTTISPVSVDATGNTANQNIGVQKGTFSEASVTLAQGQGNQNEGNTDPNTYVFGDFGFVPPPDPVSLGDTVFIDTNKNGKLDTGELPVSGAKVELVSNGNVISTQITGTNGKYLFTNLQSGTYTVRLTPPTGFTLTPVTVDPTQNTGNQNVGTQNGNVVEATVTVVSGQAPLVEGNTDVNNFVIGDFGLVAPPVSKLSGFVYRDPNLNGQFVRGTAPNGDTPIINATLNLFDGAGNKVATTKTDATGFYQFDNLLPGTYQVREVQPAGLLDGFDTPGATTDSTPSNDVITVTLAANENKPNNNFGEFAPTSVEGYVWVDTNKNCQFDPATEVGVGGVPIVISGTAYAGTSLARPLTAADVPGGLTFVTDANGHYVFPTLPPGSYTVTRGDVPASITGLADWCEQNNDPNGPAPTITNNQFSNVTTNPNVVRASLNFGLVPVSNVVIPGLDPSKRQFLGSTGTGTGPVSPPPTTIPPPGGPNTAAVPLSPTFAVSNAAATSAYTVIGSGAGISPLVRVMDYATGGEKFRITPFETSFTGGVRVAQGDVTGDGVADIVATTGIGGGPRTRVFDGATGNSVQDYFAFESSFRGGTFVAVGDINGDGFRDVVVTPEVGGGPRVRTFSGKDGSELNNFFAFDSTQRGGVRVAVADFNNDGKGDIAVVTGAGVPTRVRVFDGTNVSNILQDFAPYETAFTGGATIAAGDFNGDGKADLLVGAELGGGPRAIIFDGTNQNRILDTFLYESSFRGGVRVGAQDVNGDGRAEVVAIAGPGGSARVRVINVATLQDLDTYFAFSPEFTGGAYVG